MAQALLAKSSLVLGAMRRDADAHDGGYPHGRSALCALTIGFEIGRERTIKNVLDENTPVIWTKN